MRQEQYFGELYNKRVKQNGKEVVRYLTRIGSNSGLYYLFILFLYAYIQGTTWLNQWVTNQQLFLAVVAIVLAIFVTKSHIRTFFTDTDITFLLPAEPYLRGFFTKSILYSFAIHALQSVLLVMFIYPLFLAKTESVPLFLLTLFAVILLKGLHLLYHFQYRQGSIFTNRFVQIIIAFALFMSLFFKPILFLVLFGVTSYLIIMKTSLLIPSFHWKILVEEEKKRKSGFISIINIFVDVPKEQIVVRRRAWLVSLFTKHPYATKSPFFYLFGRSLVRQGEFFGIYIRLTLLMYIAICLTTNIYVGILIVLIGLHLSANQLGYHVKINNYPMLLRTYPVTNEDAKLGISHVSVLMLGIQILLLIVVSPIAQLSVVEILLLQGIGICYLLFVSLKIVPNKVML
ncbi:ABC transporter permease [Brevibacillus daliensis]|uniref:ABC transporter permease n=1 Tax=Brevibacillus daliensis TaxID=2892995 RepID=UPI001E57139F|nr:ABC transporter permease [Brevibacillus daliensis]